jgi:hypothetical protein
MKNWRDMFYLIAGVTFFWTVIFAGIITLSSCQEQGETIDTSISHAEEPIRLTVYLYKNSHDITTVYQSLNVREEIKYKREGFAMWQTQPPGNNVCVLHIPELRGLDDPRMKTWGHELAHCVHEDFHTKVSE